jgi:hypothetical protein
MLILTRLLYNYDEVRINLLLSLLKKKDFLEVIFWSSEIYCSGFKEELWLYIWKIYYDFYALLSPSKEIKKNHRKYKDSEKDSEKDSFKYIQKSLFVLFHGKVSFDVFIVNNLYKVRRISTKTKMKFSNMEKMMKFFIEKRLLKKFVIKLKHSLQINKEKTIKFIMEEFGIHNIEIEEQCIFQQLFIISQTKMLKTQTKQVKKPKIKMSKLQKVYALKLLDFTFKKHIFKYKILEIMRHYSISEHTNGFKLERGKLDIKMLFRQNWEYHANFSPFWKNKIEMCKGKIKNKKIVFKNDRYYQAFYEHYNLEPDEQRLDVQEKSTKNLKKYKTTELITKLFGDKPILLDLDNKIDLQKVKY